MAEQVNSVLDQARQIPGFNELPDADKVDLVTRMLDKASGGAPANTPTAPATTSTDTATVLPMSPVQAAWSALKGEQRLTTSPPAELTAGKTWRVTMTDPAELAQEASTQSEQTGAGKLLKRLGAEAALTSVGGTFFGLAPRGFQLLGRMANSGAATWVAQQLGLAPPGAETVGESALSVPVVEGVVRGAQAVARPAFRHFFPGTAGALHEDAAAEIRGMLEGLRPENLPAQRAAVASMGNLMVPLQNLENETLRIMQNEAALGPRLRETRLMGLAQELWQDIQGGMHQIQQPGLSLGEVRVRLDRIGQRIGDLRRAMGPGAGSTGSTPLYQGYRDLYRGILNDLDALPGTVSPQLMAFRRALRQDLGAQDLTRILEPFMQQRNVDGLIVVNGRAMWRALEQGRNSQFLRESFTPEQLQGVREVLGRARALPAVPSPQGVAVGSSITLGRIGGSMAIGSLLAPAMGYDRGTGAAVGGAIGAFAPRILARGLMTPQGRDFVRRVLADTPFFTLQDMQQLALLGRAVNDNPEGVKAIPGDAAMAAQYLKDIHGSSPSVGAP